nr:MAG TPA: hypothetical protein [Caudoviricetes sp.]
MGYKKNRSFPAHRSNSVEKVWKIGDLKFIALWQHYH